MDENKKIEKLSEQSAEKVAGGVKLPSALGNLLGAKNCVTFECADCGKSKQVYFRNIPPSMIESGFFRHEDKWYCSICLAKHTATAAEPAPIADAGLSN